MLLLAERGGDMREEQKGGKAMKRLVTALLDLLFPQKCPFCGKLTEGTAVCGTCRQALPWTVGGDILWEGPGGVRCAAPLWYQDKVREGLLRFKFQGGSAAAEPLGELVAQCAAEELSGAFDTVTWVPVSRKRLRERGYDQAELLARAACRLWDTEPVRLLKKTVHTPAQSGLEEATARRANVLGAYEVCCGAAVRDRQILLVDDICTTGATLAECVRVLKDAGAGAVVCAAVARTPVENARKGAE